MWHGHIRKHFVGFCNGELEAELVGRVEEHLRVCRRCRKEYEEVSRGVFLAKHLSRPASSTTSWSDVERGIVDGHDRTVPKALASHPRASFSWLGPAVFAAAFLTLALTASLFYRSRQPSGVNLDDYLSSVEKAASGRVGETIVAAPPGFEAAERHAALQAGGVESMAAVPPLAGYSLIQQHMLRVGEEKVVQLDYGNGSEFFSVFVAPREVPFSFGKRKIQPLELNGVQCNQVSCPRTATVLFSAQRFHCVLVTKSNDKDALAAIVRYFLSAHIAWRPS
jgi:anti-sigma factor RsiW